jgi:hypothetical protein
MAKLHGAKPKTDSPISTTSDGEGGTHTVIKDEGMLFKDPSHYAGMTLEERKKLTEQMILKHKGIQFLGGGGNG